MQEAQQCADALCAYVASAASALPPSECEVLYGRAGLLYALLFTERTSPTVTIQQDLFQVRLIHTSALGFPFCFIERSSHSSHATASVVWVGHALHASDGQSSPLGPSMATIPRDEMIQCAECDTCRC